MFRINTVAALGASLALTGGALSAQTGAVPGARAFAVTSAPINAPDLVEADLTIESMIRTGDLVLLSGKPDRQLPGRRHEYLGQIHRGVPLYGAGLARQRQDNATISVFGTVYDDIDIDPVPTLSAEAALARIEAVAGAPQATSEAPRLAILPTELGDLVLTWSAPMRDFRTYFVDAHTGALVHEVDHIYNESAVGFGMGITGTSQKLSVWYDGHNYQAWDRLRPAEIVTMDARGVLISPFALFLPTPDWIGAVAVSADNSWTTPAIVDGHANLGFTYDYLYGTHGWRGLDGADGRVFALANIAEYYNAFFLSAPFGPQQTGMMGFGAARNDTPLVPLDVVAHEFMHGVTYSALVARTGAPLLSRYFHLQGPASLTWEGKTYRCGDRYVIETATREIEVRLLCRTEPDDGGRPELGTSGTHFALFVNHGGAVNEAYSDIIGTAAEHATHLRGEGPLRADYRLGEDAGDVVRRIDRPRSLPIGTRLPGFHYPDTIGQAFRFVLGVDDRNRAYLTGLGRQGNRTFKLPTDGYGGIHWNSTILSHAFYLAIEGGTHSSGVEVQGVGWENRDRVERAYFRAMADLAPPIVTFQFMGFLIRQSALDLHGSGSAAFVAIHEALTAVGL